MLQSNFMPRFTQTLTYLEKTAIKKAVFNFSSEQVEEQNALTPAISETETASLLKLKNFKFSKAGYFLTQILTRFLLNYKRYILRLWTRENYVELSQVLGKR